MSLTKVFAELFSKSDRVPRRHTNNSALTKSRKFSYLTAPYTAFFIPPKSPIEVIPIPTKIHRRYGRTVMVLTAENTVPAAALDETAVKLYEKAAEDFVQYCTSAADAIAEDARANGMRRFVTSHASIRIIPVRSAPNEVKISLTAVLPDSSTHTELHTWRRLKNMWLMTKREN